MKENHSLQFFHILFEDRLPALTRLLGFDLGPFPVSGGRATVVQFVKLSSRMKGPVAVGASWRHVSDMSDDGLTLTCLPGEDFYLQLNRNSFLNIPSTMRNSRRAFGSNSFRDLCGGHEQVAQVPLQESPKIRNEVRKDATDSANRRDSVDRTYLPLHYLKPYKASLSIYIIFT